MTRCTKDPGQPPVYGMEHSEYRCRDAEETRVFYEDVVGFPLALALHIDRHPVTGEPGNICTSSSTSAAAIPSVPATSVLRGVDHPGDNHAELFKKRWDGLALRDARR